MRERGFTLLEVMVALAIAGLLFIGVGAALQEQSRTESHLQRKAAAAQVVRNHLAEVVMRQEPLEEGAVTGQAEMGGWLFDWRQVVTIVLQEDDAGDPQPHSFRLEVSVEENGQIVEQGVLYLTLQFEGGSGA